ncbi:MAG: hypothetical protein ACI35O_16900 [Bacillaceae bacterium]
MIQLYRFNEEGYYIEPVIIDMDKNGEYIIPEDCTEIELPQPNYKPKFNKDRLVWEETVSEDELEEILNPPTQKTEIDVLKENNLKLESALIELTEISSAQELRVKELENAILELTQSASSQESASSEMEEVSLELTEVASQNEIKSIENEKGLLETTVLVGGMTNV